MGYFIFISATLAGQGKLAFMKSTHDFGQIKEVDGLAEYSFFFVNTGDQPLLVSDVKPSCGCATPFWTKEKILPGDTGYVSVQYNTQNRPGAFTKSLQVISDALNPTISLFVKGHVKPNPRMIEDDLPIKYGAMRVKYRSFNMGNVTTEKVITESFDVYNDADSAFSFMVDELKRPDHISLTFEPVELQAKEKGVIKITYDPLKKNDLGYQTDEIIIKTNEVTDNEKVVFVIATIEEFFPPMTEEELDHAPKLTFNKKSHNFGKVAKDAVVEGTFILINAGKNELKIRRTTANCDCTTSSLEKNMLQPNESVKMKITFDTKGRRGKQFKNISIFSNDPVTPTQMVTIKAEVAE